MPLPRPRRSWSNEDALIRVLGVCGVLLIGGLLYLHFNHRKSAPPPSAPQPLGRLTEVRGLTAQPSARAPHYRFDQAACLARTGRRLAPAPTVHRWVDAAGVVHYSDRRPESTDSRDHSQRLADDAPPVTVTIEPVDARLPPHAISRAISDAVALGKVFKDVFDLDTGGGLALRVSLAGSDAAFRPKRCVNSSSGSALRKRIPPSISACSISWCARR